MDLEVKVHEVKAGNYTILPKGRIDSETTPRFQKQIQPVIDQKAKNVLLNMAHVNYVSSAGLGAIFTLMKKLKENGGDLLLCNLQPQIKKVFEIIKALPTTSIFSSVEEADSYLDHIMRKELDPGKDG